MRTILLLCFWVLYSASALSQNLVAYYPFNGNANDQSGNAINPTYIGAGVTLTTDRFGNANSAYNFDGLTGSYIRMPADLLPTTNRTISLWFNVTDVSNRPGLLGYGGNGSCGTTLIMGLNCTGTGTYFVQGHCGNNGAGYTYPAPPVNSWYHWVLTINGADQKIYVNGELKSTTSSFGGSTAVTGKDLALGVITSLNGTAPYTDANVGYTNGKLDDIRIYNAAMSDAQVMQLYNNESVGLVAFYPFNGNANDESGNGINSNYTGAGVSLNADRFGNANKAYYFNGAVGSYIRIPADNFPATNRTISFWFNADDPAVYRVPFSYGGNACNASCFLMILNQGGSGTYTKSGHCDVERIVVPYSTPPVNSWKQWVITVNGTVQKIYIDGILQSPSLIENFSTATYVPGRSVLLGAMVNTDGNSVYQDGIWNFKGKMDEFRIYNNAMTDAQVLSLYNSESTGMVAYYPFNGNANDESGNGNNGTVNGAVLTADRFNNTNRAYAFNGTSDYINVPDAATIRPGAEISLSAWVKRTRLGIDIIAEKGGDWTGGTCNYGMGLHNINNNMFYFYFNGGWRGTDGVSDLNWHHYVVVAKTGDVNPVLYIDGQPKPVLYSSGAGSIVMNNSAEDLHIGSQVGAATYYGANLIDELNIYRRNLSATEVQKIYNQSATGLVAYYPFNANANDESGNGNNGTVNGATLITDRFGNANKAYNFTNPNHISVPNTNMFGDEFSVSYWFKINSYFGQRGVMSNVAVPNGGFQQALDGTTFSYILGYNFPLTNDPLFSNYTMLEPLSQWHHVALTYKKTGAVSSETQLFINGELKRSNTHSLSISFTPNAMYYIGQNHSGLNFQGDLDDIKIYKRVLSPNEILQLADIPMMPDLLAYLPMNGNANDMSGNSRHGIVVNATATTDKYENNNAAYQFNGNGSGTSITLANSTSLDLLGTPFTISTWVKFSTATGEPKMIAGKHNCGSATGYFVGVDNNRLSYWLASGGSWSQVLTTETFNDNKWHHIVGTYDGVEQKLYVDGIFKAGTSTNYNTPASGAPIKVGEPSGACGGTGLFNGKVDELKMYNGALDVAQVKALYKQSRGSGNALKFDGVNDIVAIPNGGALNNLQTGTIDLWVKWNGINQDPSSGDAYGAITGRQLNSVFSNQIIALNGADPNNAGIIWKPYSSVATTMTSSLSPGNKWNHLAIVYSSGNHKMYLNGIEVASSIDAGTIADGAVPLTLGGWIDHGNCFANADLDEVRIWNIALTQTQIREWMNRKITAAHPAYSNLAGYYNFDEPHLQLAYDSKNGITGTMINGPSWVISGAAIGDTSAYDFINAIKTTTLTVAAGENFTATATGGAPSGISVYEVKDIPNTTNGTVGIGENDHYFGVHVSGGTAPQYTATYNYTGNIIVTPASEPTLQLYKRNNNSDTLWTNSGATLNMPANTLTITGQNTEYIIAAGGTEPVPDAVAAPQNQIICSGSSITTILITGSVPSTVFNWTRDNTTTVTGIAASGAGDISGTLTNTTNAAILVTFTITPTVGVITGTPITATVTVNPTATVTTVLNQVICNGAATPAVNFTSTATGGTIVYDWTNNTTSIGLAASGTGDIASFTAINATTAPVMATITVTPTYTNGGVSCAGTPSTFTITVNPTATVTTVPNQVVCNGAATTAVNFTSTATGGTIVYDWTNNTTSIGLAASGTGDIASFTAINATTAPVMATITVTPTYTNGGVSCAGTPSTFTITVNPTATVTAVANQVVCNGAATTAVNFTSTATGGTIVYDWTNNTTSIGLAASGTGDIASFTAINTTNAPVTATITVTPNYTNGGVSCAGTPSTFTITVNPTATVTTVANQVVCNGEATTAVNFTSTATGGTIVYNWTNNTTSIGLASSGSGNIGSFTATNTTTTPVTATITVTPTYTNGGTSCVGTPTTFTITVNPTATVTTVPNQVVCNGAATTAVNFTSTATGGTIIYNWTNNTTSIGLASSGIGNIASFTATNTTSAPVAATITVTPTYTNGGTSCAGTPSTFTITVNPTATVTAVANQVVCNGAATTAINFTSTATGGTIVYNWTNNTTSIGLASSGIGNIASFTATNTTNAPVTATITVTATYTIGGTSCVGTPTTFTITVNPTATVTTVPNQVVCNGATTTAVNFTSTATGGTIVYNWTNNTTGIGLGASGSGNIGSFTAINTTNVPVTATITVTPTYTNTGVSCAGTPSIFTITVNPTPNVISVPASQVICSGSPIITIVSSGNIPGTVFNWTRDNTATVSGIAASGTGNVSGTLVNNTVSPITVIFTITPTYTNGGVTCSGPTATASVLVNPQPVASISYTGSPYCTTVTSAPVTLTGTTGGTYSAAPAGLTINAATGTVNPSTSTPGTYTVTYTLAGCAAFTATASITITAAPNMIIFYAGSPYCSNAGTANVTRFGTGGGTYSAAPAGLTINATTGAVTLGTSTPGTYTVTYTIAPSGGCGTTITTTTITITAAPNATIAYAGSPYCSNAGTANVTLTGSPAGGVYSSTAGLSINAATGAVNLAASTAGTYTVTYTVAASGGCALYTTTTTITITALPAATIAYTGSPYCSNAGTATVTRTGTAGGTYTAAPAGLSINAATGAVNLAASTAGTYTVTYTLAAGGGCPAVAATTSITITTAPAATISYAGTPFCQPGGIATVTRTGTAGGTYSATPAGLSINATSGDINVTTSTPGTYTVTYTLAAGGGCPVVNATTSVTINAPSVAPTAANATATALCGSGTVTLSVVGGSLGSGATWRWYSGSCGGTAAGTGATLNVTVTTTTTYFVRAEGACNTTACASVTVTVNTQPTISIAASPGTVLKPFTTTTLTATVTPVAGNTIVWYRNGNVVPGATGPTLLVTIDGLGLYTARVTSGAGCNTLSNAVQITSEGMNQLFITPNPNEGQFKVRYYTNATQLGFVRHLVMFAGNGQKVFDQTYPITAPYSSMNVDARLLSKGMYLVMLTDAFGKEVLATGRVVIQ